MRKCLVYRNSLKKHSKKSKILQYEFVRRKSAQVVMRKNRQKKVSDKGDRYGIK